MGNFDKNSSFVGAELAENDQNIVQKFTRGDLISSKVIIFDRKWLKINRKWLSKLENQNKPKDHGGALQKQ